MNSGLSEMTGNSKRKNNRECAVLEDSFRTPFAYKYRT